MNYRCKIYRNPGNKSFWLWVGLRSVRLPLFDRYPKIVRQVCETGDYLVFMIEDRHNPDYLFCYPPSEITEEQLTIINNSWNFCVENNLDSLQFDI